MFLFIFKLLLVGVFLSYLLTTYLDLDTATLEGLNTLFIFSAFDWVLILLEEDFFFLKSKELGDKYFFVYESPSLT